jgi:hypothetical protein
MTKNVSCVVVAAFALASCDAWPTTVIDRSNTTIQFRWLHEDYADWSAWTIIPAGESVVLARAHYVEDFSGIEVVEAGQTYAASTTQMAAFRKTCARSFVDRLTTLGDCEIIYSGQGAFSVRRVR